MSKLMYVAGVFLLLAVMAQAVVKEVYIVQTTGSSAYTVGGNLEWTMGTSGTIYTDEFEPFNFVNATVHATFSGMTDLSVMGNAKAKFSTGNWEMSLTQGPASVHLAGTIINDYTEQEIWEDGVCGLDGRAVVRLGTATFSGFGIDTLVWGNSRNLGGIIASIVFPPGYDITDYTTGYSTNNLTVTLLADESSIPEPATMLLLGLGAVLLRKKK